MCDFSNAEPGLFDFYDRFVASRPTNTHSTTLPRVESPSVRSLLSSSPSSPRLHSSAGPSSLRIPVDGRRDHYLTPLSVLGPAQHLNLVPSTKPCPRLRHRQSLYKTSGVCTPTVHPQLINTLLSSHYPPTTLHITSRAIFLSYTHIHIYSGKSALSKKHLSNQACLLITTPARASPRIPPCLQLQLRLERGYSYMITPIPLPGAGRSPVSSIWPTEPKWPKSSSTSPRDRKRRSQSRSACSERRHKRNFNASHPTRPRRWVGCTVDVDRAFDTPNCLHPLSNPSHLRNAQLSKHHSSQQYHPPLSQPSSSSPRPQCIFRSPEINPSKCILVPFSLPPCSPFSERSFPTI